MKTQVSRSANKTTAIVIMMLLAVALWNSRAIGAPARNRYLLLDSRIIDNTENAELTLGAVNKNPRNPLFMEDQPWEPRYDNVYANVIYDEQEKIYKCWYSPFIIDERTSETPPEKRNPESQNYMRARPNHREMGVCYAISKDGIHWKKPEVGLVEFKGSKKNNLLLRGEDMRGMFYGPHGAGVFKDMHESDLARRYKIFARAERMAVVFSPDGVHWDEPVACPEIQAPGDTHNNAFWDPASGKYIGITRLKTSDNVRLVGRTESSDFVSWTKSEVVFQGVSDQLQTHDMVVFPAGGVYIGLLGIMDFPRKGSNYNVKQHVELAWSPDTITWHRIKEGTPFIGHSPGANEEYGKMPYDWGTIFASAPIFLDDEVRIYYGACDWYFFDWRKGYLALATLRPDGWAGYAPVADDKPAFVATRPITCSGDKLQLSADIQSNGFVTVTLLDKENRKLAESKPVKDTVTDAGVKWKKGFSVKNVKGKDVRLKFELKNAKLYSFGFDLISQAKIDSALARSVVDRKEDVDRIVAELIEQKKEQEAANREKERAERIWRSLPPEKKIHGLIANLRDEQDDVRSAAADELANIAPQVKDEKALRPAVAPLVAAMVDDDMDVRDESAEALGVIASRIKDDPAINSAVEALVKGLGDTEAEVREECAEALGRIASKSKDKTVLAPAVKPLIKALQDERQATRDFAARALRDIGTSEAKAALK